MILITKTKIYIKNPSEAPEGVKVETGERGGRYYESEGQSVSQEKPKQLYISPYEKTKLKNPNDPYYESGEMKPGQSFIPKRQYVSGNLYLVPNGAIARRDDEGFLYYESEFERDGKIYTWLRVKPPEPEMKPPEPEIKIPEKDEINKIYKNSPDGISNIMEAWYEGGSGQLSLDQTITKVFNLNSSDSRTEGNPAIIGELTNEELNDIKKIYTITQTYLRKKYPNGKITLYRGVDGNTFWAFKNKRKNSNIILQTYNISSWSESIHIAENFAEKQGKGVIIKIEVPIERIFSYHEIDSFAAEGEAEATLIGPSITGKLLKKINTNEEDEYNPEEE